MAAISFEDRWPIVIVSFGGQCTDREFADYLAQLDAYYTRAQKMAVILHTLPGYTPRRVDDQAQARWLKERRELLKQYCVGTSFVFHSMAMRFLLSAVFVVQPLPMPYQVCATLEEALRWSRDRLLACGVPARQVVATIAR